MHRIVLSSPALLVATALTLACSSEPAPSPTKAATQRAERGAGPLSEAPAATNPSGAPQITVDEPVHDFGGIKASDTAEHVFKIRNTGDADLKIERVEKT